MNSSSFILIKMAKGQVTFLAIFVLSLLLCKEVLSVEPPTVGFTLSLIPRDSLTTSALSNSDVDTQFIRIQSAITRSIHRAKQISSSKLGLASTSEPVTDIIFTNGEYLMNISIGTPPFPILAVADTGSDLTWTQCKPCLNCYNQTATLFDSSKSSTYKPVSCCVPQCSTRATAFDPFCSESKKCNYSIHYGDKSTSTGGIATETVTLGTSKFSKILIGCGFNNKGTFTQDGSGIIGLGNGPDSLIGQIEKSIGGRFSYCLVQYVDNGMKSSVINFGRNADVSGNDVVSTPLISKEPSSFYWMTVEAITVGKVRVPFSVSAGIGEDSDSKGNFLIDSGTTLLFLPEEFYYAVEAEVAKQVKGKIIQNTQLNLCYEETGFVTPEIMVNFEGADVKVNDYNMFVLVEKGVACFAAAPSEFGIYGNLAQMNFLIGYDKVKKSISFKGMDCSRYSN